MVQLPAAAEIPAAFDLDWPRRMTHPSPNDRAPRELVFLGTGTSTGIPVIGCDCEVCQSENPRFKRLRCSVLIASPAGRILIDTTPDLRQQFLREKIPFAHAVLYTHHHADHVFGLDDVRTFSRHLGKPLPIYCDPGTEAFIRKAFSYVVRRRRAGVSGGWRAETRIPSIRGAEHARSRSRRHGHPIGTWSVSISWVSFRRSGVLHRRQPHSGSELAIAGGSRDSFWTRFGRKNIRRTFRSKRPLASLNGFGRDEHILLTCRAR